MKRHLVVLLLAILLVRCGGDEDTGPDPDVKTDPDPIANRAPVPQPTALNCPRGTPLTYDNFGAAYMRRYCTTCHAAALPDGARGGAPLAVNLDTAQGVAIFRAGILLRTSGAATPGAPAAMPPSGNVVPTDAALLKEWLDCGAPTGS